MTETITYKNRPWTVIKRETAEQVSETLPLLADLMRKHGKVAQLQLISPRGKGALAYEYANGRLQVIPV